MKQILVINRRKFKFKKSENYNYDFEQKFSVGTQHFKAIPSVIIFVDDFRKNIILKINNLLK